MKLFLDIVEDRFFLPLTNRSKRLYEEVIFAIFDWVEELDEYNENDRSAITEKLVDLLDKKLQPNVYDEDGNLVPGDNRQRAQAMIRHLINCRWIFEESKGNGNYSINFYDYSYKVIAMMKQIKEDKPNSYQSELRIILRSIETFDTYDIVSFNDVHKAIEDLSNMLKSLRSNINKYYANIITDSNTEDLKIIAENLEEYRIEFFDRAYYRFKTELDSSNSIHYIIEEVEKLYDLGLQRFVNSYKHEFDDKQTDDEILEILNNKLLQMLKNLRGMDTVIANIEEKNTKYLSSLINKIFYIINRGSDITGLLNQAISQTISDNLKDFSFINLNEQKHYTIERMFYPKKRREQLEPVFTKDVSKLTEEDLLALKETIAQSFKYSIININKYVLELLRHNDKASATDIKLDSEEDYIKILLIALYGNINETDYYIELTGEKAIIDNIKFDNYIIYRKDNTNE